MRKPIIERHGSLYRDKQEGLDHIDELEASGKPIYGLEIVRMNKNKTENSMFKTVWYSDPAECYEQARTFLREQMVAGWNYVEFK